MEHAAEDYYDMPVEMLPSANFAGRPTSEISTSMLDGLWTMMVYSASSSEDEGEHDADDTTPQLRTPPRSPLSQRQPESPETPTIRITSPPVNEDLRRWSGSFSNDVHVKDQPRLRKKSYTAPPGALDAFVVPSLEPRRAISARLTYTRTIRRGQPKPHDRFTNCLDIREASSGERLGPRKALPKPPCQDHEAMLPGGKHHPGPLSNKARVQETLKQKQLRTLNTALADYESKRLPTSPSSMLSTPRECYAVPDEVATSETLGSPRSSRSWGRKSVRSVKTVLDHKIHSPLSAHANVQDGHTLKRKHKNVDVDAAERRRVYLPGAIMLAAHPAKLRRDSVATLDPFTFDTKLDSPERRISDTLGLDGIVMFFEEFGVVGEVSEVTFDQYWSRESLAMSDDMDEEAEEEDMAACKSSVCSVEETGPMCPRVAQSAPREGLKSKFSSASSTVSMHAPEKRKRSRLRGLLLSPGLPGTAFLKSPATWGQAMESSRPS